MEKVSIFLGMTLFLVSMAGGVMPGVSAEAVSAAHCAPLPPPGGPTILVDTVNELVDAVNNASAGDTVLIANGTYNLNGAYLRVDTPNVTLRSASGNREAVILDGNYQTTEIVQVVASNVTIADLTLREAYYHPIHVMSESSDTINTRIYNVHIIDPGEQAIKINPAVGGHYTDDGLIACSHIELTDTGRPYIRNDCYTGGIDAHQSRGWVIRDNEIEGFWCASGLSEHGIHLWRGCRDTTIERNLLRDNARGIGLGLATSGDGRTYSDNPCPAASGYVDDFGGVIRNNFVAANDAGLFASQYGFDCGICLWNACNAQALHNTIYTADPGSTFSAIEWRFPNTQALITNNLVNHVLRERDGAAGTLSGNVTTASTSWFVDAASADLHLVSSATLAIDRVAAPPGVSDDVDGDPRPLGAASDVGADEYGVPPPNAVSDLRVTEAITATGTITITLQWTASLGAQYQAIRYALAPIDETNWASASLMAAGLPGSDNSYQATIAYTGGTLYFAQKSYNAAGGWSLLSNNAFWPRFDVYLPVILR